MIIPLPNLPGGPGEGTVDNKVRKDWNDYLDFLEKKKMRGQPGLDTEGVGYKLFDEYVSSNKGTTLKREMLPVIRNEFLKYRDFALNEIKNKRAEFAPGANEENFMKFLVENEKTANPDYPGSMFTSVKFPESYLKKFMNDKLVGTAALGFAQKSNP